MSYDEHDEPRAPIRKARMLLKDLLGTLVSKYMPPDTIDDFFPHWEPSPSDFVRWRMTGAELRDELRTEIDPSTATLRDYLGVIAHNDMDDPFITEKRRNEIQHTHNHQAIYEDYVAELDRETVPRGFNLRVWHGFMDALADFADKGSRLPPGVFRAGIVMLQRLEQQETTEAAAMQAASASTDILKEKFYTESAEDVIRNLHSPEVLKPNFLEDVLYKKIRQYHEMRQTDETRRNVYERLVAEVAGILKQHTEISVDDLETARETFAKNAIVHQQEAMMIQDMVTGLQEIAQKLKISLRTFDRGES